MNQQSLKKRLHEIIFEAETKSGKTFDVFLLWAIVFSVLAVLLESVRGIQQSYGTILRYFEWTFTVLFTVEYFIRLYCVKKPLKYALSFFGVIDLLALIPTYLSFIFAGAHSLLVIRALRLLRVFRVLKLGRFVDESRVLVLALKKSREKITIFFGFVICLALIVGSLMYLIEGEAHGFTSIPKSIYWAIVTMTTVGFGDITPNTTLGQILSSLVMIMGYAIIAVPTGIISATMAHADRELNTTITCPSCTKEGHAKNADFCYTCGEKL